MTSWPPSGPGGSWWRSSAIAPRLWIVVAALLFSTGGAAIKLAELEPAQIASLRAGVAFLVLVIFSRGARAGFGRRGLRALPVGIAFAATMLLYVAANRTTTAANAVFLQSTAPLYVLLLGPFLLREPLVKRDLVTLGWMALGLTLFFAAPGAVQKTAPAPLLGNALGAAAGLTWALTVIGLRWLGGEGEALGAVALGTALACLGALPFALPLDGIGALDLGVIAWLGTFQIAIAYLFGTAGLRRVPAFEASLLFLLEPVLNPVWAFAVHGERPGGWALAGGGVILAAGLRSALRRRAPSAPSHRADRETEPEPGDQRAST